MGQTYERDLAGSSTVIPLDKGGQLRVQRRGGNLHEFSRFGPKQRCSNRPLGIKLAEHGPIQRQLADISPRGLGFPLRRDVVGFEIDDQNLVIRRPPGGRFAPKPAPAVGAGVRAGRRSRPRHGCPAQIPAQSARQQSTPVRLPPAPVVRPRSSPRRCGRDKRARHRGVARLRISGSDCSSRCTSVPR